MGEIATRQEYEQPLAWTANEVWLARHHLAGACGRALRKAPPYPRSSALCAHSQAAPSPPRTCALPNLLINLNPTRRLEYIAISQVFLPLTLPLQSLAPTSLSPYLYPNAAVSHPTWRRLTTLTKHHQPRSSARDRRPRSRLLMASSPRTAYTSTSRPPPIMAVLR